MKSFKLISVFIVCTLLLLSSERTFAHGGITIDGDCSGDWGNSLPAAIHTYQVLTGAGGTEWVYRGEAGDARDSGGTTTSNNDIVEVRFTGDDTFFYFCVKMDDITDWLYPNINLAVDIDQNATDPGLNWIGDDTCESCGGVGSYTIANPIDYVDRQFNAHYTNGNPFDTEFPENVQVLFDYAPDGWISLSDATAAASADTNSIEGKIAWWLFGCSSGPCDELKINLTSYRNMPNINDGSDTTYDLTGGDGIDLMGGTSGVSENAWERDFSEGVLSSFYTVKFDSPTAVRLHEASADSQPEYMLYLLGGLFLCLVGFMWSKRKQPNQGK